VQANDREEAQRIAAKCTNPNIYDEPDPRCPDAKVAPEKMLPFCLGKNDKWADPRVVSKACEEKQ
jgi:hypothetical protein